MELLIVIALTLGFLTISLLRKGRPTAPSPEAEAWWRRTGSDPVAGPVVRADRDRFLGLCHGLLERRGLRLVEEDREEGRSGEILYRARSDRPLTGGEYVIVLRHATPETGPVSRERVIELSGAVRARGALKGIYLTNGRFAAGTQEGVEGAPVELLDGRELASLLAGEGLI